MDDLISADDFIFLIRIGEDEAVQHLVHQFNLFKVLDSEERTLLHYSINFDNKVITKYLLDGGCPVNHEDREKITPLNLAMRRQNSEMMKILFERGANVISGLSLFVAEPNLSPAVRKEFVQELKKKYSTIEEIAKKLLDAGSYPYQLFCSNHPALTDYLVREGHSIDSVQPHLNYTAMHFAVAHLEVGLVRELLKKGASVNVIDIDGAIPISYIYERYPEKTSERIEILQMLINSGVLLTSCTLKGSFQIQEILTQANRDVIRALFQSNIDFKSRDSFNGRSILHNIAINPNQGVADELKYYINSFDIDVHDKSKITPLMYACAYGNVGMVKFFLEHNADPNSREGICGRSPLYFTIAESKLRNSENNYYQCIELLLQYHADPQFIVTRDFEQITIFDAASKANNPNRIQPVVAHLARLEAVGTPITETTYAKIYSHKDFKKYFHVCRQILKKKIFSSVTVLELLMSNKKKLAAYFKKEKQMLQLERFSYRSRAIIAYSDYFIASRKRLFEALYDRRFKNQASEIIRKILPSYFPSLVIDKIISYLNNKDLHLLYEL